MKKITLFIKNILFGDTQSKYENFKGKYIVCSFSFVIRPKANWTIQSVNNMPYNNDTKTLAISSSINGFNSNNMLEGSTILNDSTLSRIITYFDSNYINYYVFNGRLYVYLLFNINNNGNVANLQFLRDGLTIEAEVPDDTNSVFISTINYQGIPSKQGCPNVITQTGDVNILIM